MKSAQSGVFSSSVEGSRRSQVPHEAQSMFWPWIGGRHSFGCHLPRSHLIIDRKSTRLNSSHRCISYAVFCLKNKQRAAVAHTQPQRLGYFPRKLWFACWFTVPDADVAQRACLCVLDLF